MLTRQERQGIADRAKAYKKGGEELSWDQFSYVLLGIQSWRNDEELLDRIVELCNVAIKAESSRELTVDELYLRALEAKYKCLALIKSKGVLSIIDMSNKCLEDFDGAISHYKELVEKEQQC